MALCKRCNSPLPDDAKFCTSCGAVVEQEPKAVVDPEPKVEEKIEEVKQEPVEEVVEEKATSDSTILEKEEEVIENSEEKAYTNDNEVYSNLDQTRNANPYSQTTKYTPVAPPQNMNADNNQGFQAQYEQPQYRPQVAPMDVEPPLKSKYATVSTGKWFGITLLLSIPVVGLITWIVLMCSKNVNLKNYAKSILIWFIIGVVISTASTVLCMTVLRKPIMSVVEKVKDQVKVFEDAGDLDGIIAIAKGDKDGLEDSLYFEENFSADNLANEEAAS